MALLVVGFAGCRKTSTTKDVSPNINKYVTIELLSGDRIEGRIFMEDAKEVGLLGKKGEIIFKKSQIASIQEAKPESEQAKPKPKPREAAPVDEGPKPFAALQGAHVFHKETCSLLKHQPESKMIRYSSRQEAVQDGLRPCGMCNP
jgi:hypothetical protein